LPYAKRYALDSTAYKENNVLIVDRCPECFKGLREQDPECVRREIEESFQREDK
jgi:hypothetical protein